MLLHMLALDYGPQPAASCARHSAARPDAARSPRGYAGQIYGCSVNDFVDLAKTVGFPSAVLVGVGVALFAILRIFINAHIKHINVIQQTMSTQTAILSTIVTQQESLGENISKQSQLLQAVALDLGVMSRTMDHCRKRVTP